MKIDEKLNALVEQRNDLDFEAYNLLIEIRDAGLLDASGEFSKEIDALQKRRRLLDQAIVRASVQA